MALRGSTVIKGKPTIPAIEVDTTWMSAGINIFVSQDTKIWVEQTTDMQNDIFQQAILNSFEKLNVNATMVAGGKKVLIPAHLVHERASDYQDKDFKGIEDMVNMETINDAELLVNLSIRYKNNLIFTYVGPTLLVINPFQGIPGMFDQDTMYKYIGEIIFKKGGGYKDLPPHVFAVGAEAYRCLFENEKDQSIVISGESGAGKTENAKYCMNLLTSISQYALFQHDPEGLKKLAQGKLTRSSQDIRVLVHQAQQSGIQDKILSCNPILEAFGNAKTIRNNNSSRFGKYVNMMVSRDVRKIRGAKITNYLLEKSRLVSQNANERNFHIFYHFIKGMSVEELTPYYLAVDGKKLPFDQIRYLKSLTNSYDVKGINDEILFAQLTSSLNILGFQDDFVQIFKVLAAILHLGNLVFEENTQGSDHPCSVSPPETMIILSDLLALTKEEIQLCLTVRQREVQKQFINSPLSKSDSQGMRDAWAKELYERIFNWLVEKLNQTILPEQGISYLCVGLLDIYGFEVFDTNGFEQLMINYTNEKLHQLYIIYVFKEEENVFAAEGLKEFCGQIKFTDNTLVINLLDKYPIGVFDLLDESCQIKGDDDSLLQKIRKTHLDSPLLQKPKMPSKPTFIVVHTAKDVEYLIHGFREKNKDEVSALMQKLSGSSGNTLIAVLFPAESTAQKKDKSLSKKVRSQMIELMVQLNSCDVHFARCIKPNDEKIPQMIVQDYALSQVRYLGVLDSLKVRKMNYPIRRQYQFFYKKYGDMTKNNLYPQLLRENADFRDLTMQMFKEHFPQLGPEQVLFGIKRIFIRLPAIPIIDLKFFECVERKNKYAIMIQRGWQRKKFIEQAHLFYLRIQKMKKQVKDFRMRIYYKKSLSSTIKIQQWIRRYIKESKRQLYKRQARLIQIAIKRAYALKKQLKLQENIKKWHRYARLMVRVKKLCAKLKVKMILQDAISKAWQQILNKKATQIQKVVKGHLFRKRNPDKVEQIKEVGRQCRIRVVATIIQKFGRGYLARKGIKKMHRAAYQIQGYFKMRWLSDLFQRMRVKILVIQHQVRTFLAVRRATHIKHDKYILPWETALQAQRLREENHLFGVEGYDSPQKTLNRNLGSNTNLSPFDYQSNQSPTRPRGMDSFSDNNYHSATKGKEKLVSFDEILGRDTELQMVNPKIILFAFVVDLEIFLDTSEYFSPGWASTYKDLFEQSFSSGNPIQTLHAGSAHCFVTTANGKVYSWGENDYNQCAMPKRSVNLQKLSSVTLPGRIVQVETGGDHTLFLTHDGRLFAAGSNAQKQLLGKYESYEMKELDISSSIKLVVSTHDTTISVSDDGRAFTWPVRDASGQLLKEPLQITLPLGNLVQQVSCGNRFAVLLTQHGTLFAFGQNSEGELGLGNRERQTLPTLVQVKNNIKFTQISCGLKHTLARTSLGKAYVWGWGGYGQIGNGKFNNVYEPQLIDIPDSVSQVQAAYRSSILLVDSKTVLWSGSNNTINYQSTFTHMKIQSKSPYLQSPQFSIVRIMSSYSRSYSLIYFTYAMHKNMFKSNPAKERGVFHTLTHHWLEKGIKTIDPPQIDSIQNYISEKHMKKVINVPQNVVPMQRNSYSNKTYRDNATHEGKLSSLSNHSKNNSYSIALPIKNELPHVKSSIIFQSTKDVDYQEYQSQKKVDSPQRRTQDQQIEDSDREHQELYERQKKLYLQLKEQRLISENNEVQEEEEEEKIVQPIKKQNSYYSNTKSTTSRTFLQHRKAANNNSKSPINSTTKQKKVTKKEPKIEEKEKFQQQVSTPQKLVDDSDSSETKNQSQARIIKLREIKLRLIHLKQIPQIDWTIQDHEFLKNIYNSNLCDLLDQITS